MSSRRTNTEASNELLPPSPQSFTTTEKLESGSEAFAQARPTDRRARKQLPHNPNSYSPKNITSRIPCGASLRQAYRLEGKRDLSEPPQSLTKNHLESHTDLTLRLGLPVGGLSSDRPCHYDRLTEYKFPAIPSVKYQGHRREALTTGAPPQQWDWHLFAVLGISNSACKQGETKISPGCYSIRHAVLAKVKLSGFGFER